MYICPKHQSLLIQKGNSLSCDFCEFSGSIENGLTIFSSDVKEDYDHFNANILERIHEDENKNFWHLNRKKYILDLFRKYIDKNNHILEIGAGTGNVTKMLVDHGYKAAAGELHIKGLKFAQKYGITELYRFDLFNNPFKDHFNAIGMFDVLEHLDDEKQALQGIYNMLKPDGKLIITVPAHQWLWNRKDAVNDHKRRYELETLKLLLTNNGFEIKYASHFFLFILPFLYLRKIINKDDGSKVKHEEYLKDKKVDSIMNKILNGISYLEFLLFKNTNITFGGSIRIVAIKR